MIQSFVLNHVFQQMQRTQLSAVELVPGQVFQGKVLKLFPNNMAMVQLGGMTVTARLETPLELGQRTWLQVQPGGGPISLKVISQPEKQNQATEASMEGLAKGLGVPLTKEWLAFLQKALDARIPLSGGSLRAVMQAIREVGGGTTAEDAALFAMQKALPITKETILALRSFAGNSNLEAGMKNLLQNMHDLLTRPESIAAGIKEPLQQAAGQLAAARVILAQVQEKLVSSPTKFEGQVQRTISSIEQPALLLQESGDESVSKAPLAASTQGGIKRLMIELFERLGFFHERALAQAIDREAQDWGKQAGSVKGSLLQLLQHPEAKALPAPLREQMQQLVQQLTGQQLMMAGVQEDVSFVQVALQLPLPGGKHEENALIQIESRKKGPGQLDPENCRLFFYLTMQNIGETTLDVSVVNKIVSIYLYNNWKELPALVNVLRDSLEKNLAAQGYRLSLLRVMTLPERQNDRSQSAAHGFLSSNLTHYQGVDVRV
ncbi:hypothetical protein ABEV55_07225 [Aneurinibacillus thermoaerophilus]|uniref:hypothetical protein n=1 Tax=Aneurinibacillus thermoaerophilus TaxID=143495 RepID=UPI002E20A31A|nr:hypothetical protein [Aneurinibacillus thermoaerophilus]